MKDPKYLIIACSAICVIAVGIFVARMKHSHDINIVVSENKHALTLSASFPDQDSRMVHDYIKSELKMVDLPDMRSVEIKHYETPDYKMRFYVKSRDGYIKIVLDKDENTSAAYYRLKKASEGLENLLAGR
jgi:uncharacterized protein YsxB (DUF464 family)